MPQFSGPDGQTIEVQELRFALTGEVLLEGDFPDPKREVTGVWRGVVDSWVVKPTKTGAVAVAKVHLTQADLDILPLPPGLFDDLNIERPVAEREAEEPEE